MMTAADERCIELNAMPCTVGASPPNMCRSAKRQFIAHQFHSLSPWILDPSPRPTWLACIASGKWPKLPSSTTTGMDRMGFHVAAVMQQSGQSCLRIGKANILFLDSLSSNSENREVAAVRPRRRCLYSSFWLVRYREFVPLSRFQAWP
jgi:hypothetical protein